MKHKSLFNNLCKLLGLYFGVAGSVALLDAAFNIAMYWNLRARPFGSWWSLTSMAGPLIELTAGSFLCFKSRTVADMLVRSNRPSCAECGYDLTGNESHICTECGLKALSRKANSSAARQSRNLFCAPEKVR